MLNFENMQQIKENLRDAKTNKEFMQIYKANKNEQYMKHDLSMCCFHQTYANGREVRQYTCTPNNDKYKTRNSIYVIGKANKDDDMIYIVEWLYVTKTRRGGTAWDNTYKAYTKSQIEWLIKEGRLTIDKSYK